VAQNEGWAQETIQWRCAELDPAITPGTCVTLPDISGVWRVDDWEWRDTGIELGLSRIAPTQTLTLGTTTSGQANLASDLELGPTQIVAFELPSDGTNAGDSGLIYAALSTSGNTWKGATIYVDDGTAR
jgi:hypothetical protein